MVYNITLLFLLIFSFPIPHLGNSVYVAIVLALIKLVYKRRVGILAKMLLKGYPNRLIIYTIGLILICMFFTIMNGAFEFSRTYAIVSLLVGVISTIIVYSSLNMKIAGEESPERLMEKMIVYVFVVQAVISIASFVSPAFKSIVSNFQFDEEANIADKFYTGIRGLAMSGRLYFEYAATCGLVTIFQIKRIINDGSLSIGSIVILLLIVVCGFFAGRTSMIGLGIGIGFLMLSKTTVRYKMRFIFKFLLVMFAGIGLIMIAVPSQILDFINEHLIPWVFDLFLKYMDSGSTDGSASFNRLNEMYDEVVITGHEWIIGSGKYTEPSGRYYGHVDAGYLRQLLYWGLIGTLISVTYTLKLFKLSWKAAKGIYNQRLFILTILAYTFVVHYKGDLLSICRFYYVVIFLYLLSIWQTYRQTKNCMRSNS